MMYVFLHFNVAEIRKYTTIDRYFSSLHPYLENSLLNRWCILQSLGIMEIFYYFYFTGKETKMRKLKVLQFVMVDLKVV